MKIPEVLVWNMADECCTAVNIYCSKDLRKTIAERFTEVFNEEYEKVMDLIEEEDGDCLEKEEGLSPFDGAHVTDEGVFLSFSALAMYCCYGDHLASYNAGEALEKALKTIKKEFPSIRYEGYVAYCWSDTHGGEVEQYAVSSEKNKGDVVYDFVGEAVEFVLQDDETWERLEEELEDAEESDYKEILRFFHHYSEWISPDASAKLLELADDSLRESLEEYWRELEGGADPEIEDDPDTGNLPDGYMEALDMFMMAEELGAPMTKRGEVISSDVAFDLVIRQAEAGDPEAKLTAGKFFIANHTQAETERAIRWITEAAEAGVEEAQEYMDEHSELFE